VETNDEDSGPKALADMVLTRALAILDERGVPRDVTIDRLTTFAAGAHVQIVGSALAARCFRDYAKRIEGGLFTGAASRGRRH
jgi:hypothetical protein